MTELNAAPFAHREMNEEGGLTRYGLLRPLIATVLCPPGLAGIVMGYAGFDITMRKGERDDELRWDSPIQEGECWCRGSHTAFKEMRTWQFSHAAELPIVAAAVLRAGTIQELAADFTKAPVKRVKAWLYAATRQQLEDMPDEKRPLHVKMQDWCRALVDETMRGKEYYCQVGHNFTYLYELPHGFWELFGEELAFIDSVARTNGVVQHWI